jgi:hypothetical protein
MNRIISIRGRAWIAAAALIGLGRASDAFAQQSDSAAAAALSRTGLRVRAADVRALTDDQQNLLIANLLGIVSLPQTTIREFSLSELDATLGKGADGLGASALKLGVTLNSGQAYSEDEGAVWSGRGLTAWVTGGGVARWKGFSVAVRPVAFWTQNLPFPEPLKSTGSFANPVYGDAIDLPWRFGARSYARLDAGESWLRYDSRLVTAGLANTTQEWGPAHVYPLLMGANAGGFPHIFVGTGAPWNLGVGTLAVRSTVGRLDASAYDPPHVGDERRLGAGLVASFSPSALPGLELGGGRFFHRRWPTDGVGLSAFKLPFEALLKDKLPGKDTSTADNQLASLFFRLAPKGGHVEVYGEFLRDDHSQDFRDLGAEPDHESAYMLGLRRAVPNTGDSSTRVFTIEFANGRLTDLGRVRGEDPMYIHHPITEGHTERGKLLGSPAVFGGGGLALLYDRLGPTSRWGIHVRNENLVQNQEGGTFDGRPEGFTVGEVSRGWIGAVHDLDLAAGLQAPWRRESGAMNLFVRVSWTSSGRFSAR